MIYEDKFKAKFLLIFIFFKKNSLTKKLKIISNSFYHFYY